MKAQRRGVSTIAAASVVVVILVAALVVSSTPAKTTTSTTTSTSVSTTTSTLTSTVSAKEAPLVSYSADAYATEVTSLLNGFSSSTGAQVAPLKTGGSFADANQIAAGAPDDVFVSVALTATSSQYLRNLTSNWAVGFASDQMVLAYTNATQTSAAAGVINLADTAATSNATSDWNAFYTALTSGGIKIGISNPVSDPAGLRGWLVLEAAGYVCAGGNEQAYVTPLLQNNANATGTSAAALVAPLQAGQIQFLFIYKSAAVSDGLKFLTLESHVSLGSPSLGSFYSQFSYTDSAGKTAGAPIILCVTVPLSAVNTAEALQFVQYVVHNAKGLSSSGLQPFAVAMLYNNVPPPAPIQALVSQGLVAEAGALP
ncbi:MAG TPA: substrate-binding domain-containing protein [Nitrososphaerales archaeon]|nr:substrate-binding domain-containing protein [Nitrososphaerales archaeon]